MSTVPSFSMPKDLESMFINSDLWGTDWDRRKMVDFIHHLTEYVDAEYFKFLDAAHLSATKFSVLHTREYSSQHESTTRTVYTTLRETCNPTFVRALDETMATADVVVDLLRDQASKWAKEWEGRQTISEMANPAMVRVQIDFTYLLLDGVVRPYIGHLYEGIRAVAEKMSSARNS